MVSYSLVIFLSILAAGVAVLLGFATIRFYQDREGDEEQGRHLEPSQDQAMYMREVRARNQMDIARMTGYGKYWRG